MAELLFVTEEFVRTIHDDVIALDGGLAGEYEGRLDSALGAVLSAFHYEQFDDPVTLAAWYAHALAIGHCFSDGNKRTALQILDATLIAHDIDVAFPQEEIADAVEQLAAGQLSREDLIRLVHEIVENAP